MVSIFFDYYLLLLVSLLFFYLVGSLILRLLRVDFLNPYFSLFFRYFIGLIAFVVVAAIIFTKGKTIMVGLFFIGGFGWLELVKKKKVKLFNEKLKPIPTFSLLGTLEVLVIITILFSLRYFQVFQLSGIPLEGNRDYVYYAKVSTYIANSGIESTAINFFNELKLGNPKPYHYFELWLNGASSYIFGSVSFLHLLLTTFTILTFLVYLGFSAIFSHFNCLNYYSKLISILFVIFSGFLIWGLDSISLFSDIGVFNVNSFSHPKLIIIYLFIVASVLFFLKQNEILGVLCLLCLPTVYISTAPAVLSGVFFYSIIYFIWFKKNKKQYLSLKFLFFTIYCALWVGGFYLYFFLAESPGNSSSAFENILFSQILTWQFWKTAINIVGGTSIQLTVLYFLFPLIIIFSFSNRRDNALLFKAWKFELLLFPVFFVTGIGTWAVMHNMPDAIQLFFNFFIPLLQIIIFLLIVYWLVYRKPKTIMKWLILTVLFIISFSNIVNSRSYKSHSDDYLLKVKSLVKDLKPQGVYIKSKSEYNNIYDKNVDVAILGTYLGFFDSEFHPVNISVFEIPLNINDRLYYQEKVFVESSDFYQFVLKQKALSEFVSISQSQVDFIDTHEIKYMIVSPKAELNDLLLKLVKEEIKDPMSGERFVLLK